MDGGVPSEDVDKVTAEIFKGLELKDDDIFKMMGFSAGQAQSSSSQQNSATENTEVRFW